MFDGAIRLHPRALVHAARGMIPAEELAPGDRVFWFDEASRAIRPADLVSAGPGPRTDLVELKVGTRILQASAAVRVRVLVDRRRPGRIRRRFKAEWIALRDLKVGDIVGVARKTPDLGTVQSLTMPIAVHDRRARLVTLPRLANEDLMWWAGLYVGDGFVSHGRGNRKRIEFAIPASQPDLQAELLRVSRQLFGVDGRAPDEWRVVVPGVRLVDYVETIGLGGKALMKRVPEWVFRSPEAHRLAFLGGYVDADGLVRAGRSKDMGATSANRSLLEDIRRIAVTCGIRTSRVWTFTSRHPNDRTRLMTGYRMQFSGDFDRVSCRASQRRDRMNQRRWFHKDLAPSRTTLRVHTSEWLGFATVDRVSDIGVAHTYAITFKGAHNLVAERLILAAPDMALP